MTLNNEILLYHIYQQSGKNKKLFGNKAARVNTTLLKNCWGDNYTTVVKGLVSGEYITKTKEHDYSRGLSREYALTELGYQYIKDNPITPEIKEGIKNLARNKTHKGIDLDLLKLIEEEDKHITIEGNYTFDGAENYTVTDDRNGRTYSHHTFTEKGRKLFYKGIELIEIDLPSSQLVDCTEYFRMHILPSERHNIRKLAYEKNLWPTLIKGSKYTKDDIKPAVNRVMFGGKGLLTKENLDTTWVIKHCKDDKGKPVDKNEAEAIIYTVKKFKSMWPSLVKCIVEHKKKYGYKALPNILQKREASFVHGLRMKYLHAIKATLHDAFYVLPEFYKEIKDIITQLRFYDLIHITSQIVSQCFYRGIVQLKQMVKSKICVDNWYILMDTPIRC